MNSSLGHGVEPASTTRRDARSRAAASNTSGSLYHGLNTSIECWDTTGVNAAFRGR